MGQHVLKKVGDLCSKHGLFKEIPVGENRWSVLYGPLGALLRRNLIEEWWQWTITRQNNVYSVEASSTCHCSSGSAMLCLNSLTFQGTGQAEVSKAVRQDAPFGVAQLRKCQISDCNHKTKLPLELIRCADETLMSLSYFTTTSSMNQDFDYWQRVRLKWWKRYACSPAQFSIVNVDHCDKALQKVAIQYKCPWGPVSIETITHHKSLQQEQGSDELAFPVVIHSCTSLETCLFVHLVDCFEEKAPLSSQVFRFHHRLAPYKVAVTTLNRNSSELHLVAEHIVRELRLGGVSVLNCTDTSPHLEQQFASFDEKGVNFTVIVNEESMSSGVLKLRNRDTAIEEAVHISKLPEKINKYLGS